MIKVAALCMLGALLASLLHRSEAELGLLLALGITVCAALLLVNAGEELLTFAGSIVSLTGLAPAVFTPLIKVTAIALTVRIGGAFCRDASQSSLAVVLETAGAVCAMLSALPLLRAVVELMEGWL